MAIRPLHDRVVVRRIDAETTSAGGIIIPDNAQEKPVQGEVLAVGEGAVLKDGSRRPLDLQAGERVLFGKYAGTEIELDGEELLVMHESDIMAVIEEEGKEVKAA